MWTQNMKTIAYLFTTFGLVFPLLGSQVLAQPSLEYVYPENDKLDSRGDGKSPNLGERNEIFHTAYAAYLDVRNAVKSGNNELVRYALDELWASYPRGDDIWRDIYVTPRDNPFDETDFARMPFYVSLIFYDDIINWRVKNNVLNRKADQYINLVIIVPTENRLTVTAKGEDPVTYVSTLDPDIRQNDYRAVREAFSDFDEIVFYLTEGQYNLKLVIVEHQTPTNSSIEYTEGVRSTKNSRPKEMNVLKNKYGELYSADWVFLMYPFQNKYYFELESTIGRVVSGGMGRYQGRTFLIGTIEKILYSRAGSHPLLSSDERMSWINAWLIHEHVHRIYSLYEHLNLEEKPHSYYDRDTWPSDFTGSFHQDFYSDSIKKRVMLPGEVRMYQTLKRDDGNE